MKGFEAGLGGPTKTDDALAEAFPFMAEFDAGLTLTRMGPSLARLMGPGLEGKGFAQVFSLDSPRVDLSFEALAGQSFTVFYLTALVKRGSRGMSFKGQMLPYVNGDGERRMAFLCSPSITKLSDLSLNGIGLKDFSASDTTVDFVIHLQTKQTALDEARTAREGLEAELTMRKRAEDALAALNARLESRVAERSEGLRLALDRASAENAERKVAEERARLSAMRLSETVMELERRNAQMRILNRMGDMLQSCSGIPEINSVVSDSMRLLFPSDSGFFALSADESGDEMRMAVRWGGSPRERDGMTIPRDDCWGLRRGRMHSREPGERKAVCRHLKNTGFDESTGGVCIPLVSQGRVHGLLHIRMAGNDAGSPETATSEMDSRRELLHNVSETLGLAVANLKMSERLRQMTIRDPLTGLFNRRYMEESLAKESARAQRHGKPCAVMMMDIDRFKAYNDTNGHPGGDVLLKAFGTMLSGKLRGEDVACRYGGEEFVAILPGASLENAAAKAESIRREMAEELLVMDELTGKRLPSTTVSIGISCITTHSKTVPEILAQADAALYTAKSAGRNRVVVAPPPEARGGGLENEEFDVPEER